MPGKTGNLAYGGVQRSYSFPNFHADIIPFSAAAVKCANMACEQIWIQNDPDSTGDCIIGGARLAVDGFGIKLSPGDTTGWIPIQNLNMIYHKDEASSHLNYMIIW